MNCDVHYDDELERKNTHPGLLPVEVEVLSTESVELLAKSGMTGAPRKTRIGNPTSIPTSKRVAFGKQPQAHRRSVLSDDQIAELRKRVNRSRKNRSAKPNGRISERARSSSRSADTKLLRH